jgi:arylsulfatase
VSAQSAVVEHPCGTGVIMVNLYTTPREDVSIGVRHLPMYTPIVGLAGEYLKDLIKYPPQFKIGLCT